MTPDIQDDESVPSGKDAAREWLKHKFPDATDEYLAGEYQYDLPGLLAEFLASQIAALTAERDHWKGKFELLNSFYASREDETEDETLSKATNELTDAQLRVEKLERENSSLRERLEKAEGLLRMFEGSGVRKIDDYFAADQKNEG